MNRFLIGWAEIDTTPEGTVDLAGQYYHRLSRGIHSRLSATVLALETERGAQAVMVAVDVVSVTDAFQEDLRERLRLQLPDLDVSRVFLNAIHTHNAPATEAFKSIPWLAELPEAMPAATYRAFLLARLEQAVLAAWRGRQPGGIAPAFGAARVGHCRRAAYADGTAEMYGRTDREDFLGLEGGEDSGVDLLFTFDLQRNPTGAIMNLACPAQVMEASYLISSDFTGETKRLLQQSFGPDFKMLGQISAAGCQSPRDLVRHGRGEADFWRESGVADIGRRLAAVVETGLLSAVEAIEYSPLFSHVVRTLSVPRRRVTEEEFKLAQARLLQLESVLSEEAAYRDFCDEVHRNEAVPGRSGPYDSKLHHFVLIQNNKAIVARYQDRTPTLPVEMHAVRLGGLALVTNPFELYLDFGHQIKARSPADQTFIVQLCGGSGRYVPSSRAEQLGGYGGLVINGHVGSIGGQYLVDETVRELRALWESQT